MACVPIATLAAPLTAAGIAVGFPALTAVGCAGLAATVALNRGFIAAIRASDGGARALGAIPLLWLELVVVGVGTGIGLVTYAAGRRY
jgi:hypothetical protein